MNEERKKKQKKHNRKMGEEKHCCGWRSPLILRLCVYRAYKEGVVRSQKESTADQKENGKMQNKQKEVLNRIRDTLCNSRPGCTAQ